MEPQWTFKHLSVNSLFFISFIDSIFCLFCCIHTFMIDYFLPKAIIIKILIYFTVIHNWGKFPSILKLLNTVMTQ